MEVSDVSREQALEYLKVRGIIDDELVERVYWLVGGRLLDLWTVANLLEDNTAFEGMYERT